MTLKPHRDLVGEHNAQIQAEAAQRAIVATLKQQRDEARAALSRAEGESARLREALEEVNSLVSGGICVIGHRGKDDYIRLIGRAVDKALIAPSTSQPDAVAEA